jgi:Sec7-like guanine-nucleotide exchange factor
MISARAGSIRSGWKPIFVVLSRAKSVQIKDSNERLIQDSFEVVQLIFKEHFPVVIQAGEFMNYVSCVTEFALMKGVGPVHDEIIMGSIQLLQFCARHLVQMAEDEVEQMKLKAERGLPLGE